ncbi:MAG: hypothetical protein QOG31_675 [Thermoplasmata archaeon]|jgi:frataxin-like iron-binding protein CyaY|nr:hypothetical protein [Thermoplasmata archaeon]
MPGPRYGDAKEFHGKAYHGMKVGGVHRWDYPDGYWEESKLDPQRWEVMFRSLKRRRGKAPRGSGAGVGSGYHWLIVAHQWVHKLDANTYSTILEGHKYLVAFKKPDWGKWNTQFRNQKGAPRQDHQVPAGRPRKAGGGGGRRPGGPEAQGRARQDGGGRDRDRCAGPAAEAEAAPFEKEGAGTACAYPTMTETMTGPTLGHRAELPQAVASELKSGAVNTGSAPGTVPQQSQ